MLDRTIECDRIRINEACENGAVSGEGRFSVMLRRLNWLKMALLNQPLAPRKDVGEIVWAIIDTHFETPPHQCVTMRIRSGWSALNSVSVEATPVRKQGGA